jgi:hypothetical protein
MNKGSCRLCARQGEGDEPRMTALRLDRQSDGHVDRMFRHIEIELAPPPPIIFPPAG